MLGTKGTMWTIVIVTELVMGVLADPVPKEPSATSLNAADHSRAINKVPRHDYKGVDFSDMSQVLNTKLNGSYHVRACEKWDVEELQDLQRLLHKMRNSKFDSIYQQTQDNRRMRSETIEGISEKWTELNELAANDKNPMMRVMRRDGHCHEAVMWFVHHLTEDVKLRLLESQVEIPLLSQTRHICTPGDSPEICEAYQKQITCQDCHSTVNRRELTGCFDKHNLCGYFAVLGLCSNMAKTCPKACDQCPDTPPSKFGTFETFWIDRTTILTKEVVEDLYKELYSHKNQTASSLMSLTMNQAVLVMAAKPGWIKKCHSHPSDVQLTVLSGKYFFKTPASSKPYVLQPGDNSLVPKYQPHEEGNPDEKSVALVLVRWSLPVDVNNLTIPLPEQQCSKAALPSIAVPALATTIKSNPQPLPEEWFATAVLQPFSPPQGTTTKEEMDTPFFQLSLARVAYSSVKNLFVVKVTGCDDGRRWWYKMRGNETYKSKDGESWKPVNTGWSFPSRTWTQGATLVGESSLNWMSDRQMSWWKKPFKKTSVWFWLFRESGIPFRMMFAAPPPSSIRGRPDNLAFFQMFSFSYLVDFKTYEFADEPSIMETLNNAKDMPIQCGNPYDYELFEWNSHFSMSAFMVPVDFNSNPLPTRVFYRWDKSGQYKGRIFDRAQTTEMHYNYNKDHPTFIDTAALFGPWDSDSKPAVANRGFDLNENRFSWNTTCTEFVVEKMTLGQQPPSWPKLGHAQIKGIIRKPEDAPANWVSPLTGSNRTVALIQCLFPPQLPNYPNSTSLWTWYDYTDVVSFGQRDVARPIVFMQSAPSIGVGTSLSLADYFDYNALDQGVYYRTEYQQEVIDKNCDLGKARSRDVIGSPTKSLESKHFFPH